MVVNTSTFSKGPKNVLVYIMIIILTVTCNYTIAGFENKSVAENDEPDSDQISLQIHENVNETDIKVWGVIEREIHITETQYDEIRDSIQIGIRYAIQDITKNYQNGLRPRDFMEDEDTEFADWIDTNVSPARHYNNFIFITYAPKVFRYIRSLFDINPNDYRQSFSNSSLRKVSNPGASASIFYFTENDKFIMKSLQSTEFHVLQRLLPIYREHMEKHSGSLLPKLSGLYGYKRNAVDIQLISMNNLLPSKVKMHLKYDLKGSTFKRTASIDEKLKRMPTFKDLDFGNHFRDGLFLMPHTLSDLFKSINSDCDFLKNFNIMDYSLLLGIHKIDEDTSTCSQAALARFNRLMVYSIGLESILADTATFEDEKSCPFLRGSIPAISKSGERLLLFLGIIDILQIYRITKIIENKFKTITQSKNISVQDPDFYANRFVEFLSKSVFKPVMFSEKRRTRSKQNFKAESSKPLNDDINETCVNCIKGK